MAKKKIESSFDINKPLDRLFLRIMHICDATNQPFVLGYCQTTAEYSLTIGNELNQQHFNGDIKDIELQLSTTLPWKYCAECSTHYYGGRCSCQRFLYSS